MALPFKSTTQLMSIAFKPSDQAKLIWLEAAGSVTLEFPNLTRISQKSQSTSYAHSFR